MKKAKTGANVNANNNNDNKIPQEEDIHREKDGKILAPKEKDKKYYESIFRDKESNCDHMSKFILKAY